MNETWFVYMIECSDGSIYTGITVDLDNRIRKHNSGKGAKYTRNRSPEFLKAYWSYPSRSEASKAEYRFKRLSREEKLLRIQHFIEKSLSA